MLGGVGAAGGEASLSLGLVSSKYGHTDTDNKRQHTGGWGRITESALIVAAQFRVDRTVQLTGLYS